MISHLESMESSEVSGLFDVKQVLIDHESNAEELKHLDKVAANTVGREIGDRISHMKDLKKFFPLHYKHQNSDLPNQPAQIMVMKLEGLQETVNSEV